MRLRCSGIFYYRFGRNLLLSPPVKNFDKSSAVAEMDDRLATIDMVRKLGAGVPLSAGGGAGFPCNTMWLAPRPNSVRSEWQLDPSSRLARTNMSQKLGAVLLWGLGPHLTQCCLGQA